MEETRYALLMNWLMRAWSNPGVAVVRAAAEIVLGVAIAGTVNRTAGGVILLAGWADFAFSLHQFGRAGAL